MTCIGLRRTSCSDSCRGGSVTRGGGLRAERPPCGGPGVFRSHGGRSWLVGLCWWRVVVAGGVRPVGASHDPYHQVLASGLDNFLGDHGELVDPQDAFDLAGEAAGGRKLTLVAPRSGPSATRPGLPSRQPPGTSAQEKPEQAAVVDRVFE